MQNKVYQTSKRLSGYSTCFRQWNASHSHCRFLHGYDLIFILYFEAEILDQHNWVWDFGWLKNQQYSIDNRTVKAWFDYMFDHTVIIAEDDPEFNTFKLLAEKNLIQLRTMKHYSTEKVAEYILDTLQPIIQRYSNQRVTLTQVEVWENQNNMGSCKIK
ncbi:6-carboxytetrahydropterin synthase [Thiotrichales bacterium 19S3-7]|nr:6-carboxytetrahydropterin synthase [Thiotrichales bacterium 19S3-7]MCF6802738.1 6-carboxytetrahydropterin synthase [Thiotrichales bacterium 19S3-11]